MTSNEKILRAIRICLIRILKGVIKMAATLDELTKAITANTQAVNALKTRIPAPTPPPDLQPAVDAINANTDAINAIFPAPVPADAPATA